MHTHRQRAHASTKHESIDAWNVARCTRTRPTCPTGWATARAYPGDMNPRIAWHRVLITVVVVFLVLTVGFYAASVLLAPADGRNVAGLFVGWAMFAMVGAIVFGIIDFFVRPLGGRSGDAEVIAAAEEARTGSTRTQTR